MYNMNDILTLLQSGQSADQIAKSFTDALNAAIQKQKEENAAASRRKAKIAGMTNLIEYIIDFIREYYPDVLPEDADLEISEDDVAELIDELDATIPQLVFTLKSLEDLKELAPIGTIKKRPSSEPVNFDDTIKQFFKQNGLK